jgi:uncharacterized protein YbcV (DUF1398 family)
MPIPRQRAICRAPPPLFVGAHLLDDINPKPSMHADHIRYLGRATLTGSMPFPDIVGNLLAEGVEYYHVDYVGLQMHFYSAGEGVVLVPLSYEDLPPVAQAFDAAMLKAAIVDSQQNGQKFRDFSRRAALAGVAGYFVFLRGQRVTYLGRQGDQHVEWFPGAGSADA